MRRFLRALVCGIIILSCLSTTVMAAETGIMPYYNNVSKTNSDFSITDGIAKVKLTYTGYSGTTTGAKVTTVLQKRTLWLFWSDVTEWVDTSSSPFDSFTHTYSVSSGKTYRVQITYEISGSGGATDVITEEIEASS